MKIDNPDEENPFFGQFKKDSEDISYITDGVFMGRRDAAQDDTVLYSINLTDVLSLGAKPHAFGRPDHIHYKFVDIEDKYTSDLLAILDDCVDHMDKVINEYQGRIFVHCHSGKSRSGSVVCAYFMRKNKWTFE